MLKLSKSDQAYLQKFYKIFATAEQAETYLKDCSGRVQVVMSWLKELQPQIKSLLELGSNPYFQTLLIQKYFSFDLHLANYFGDSSRNGLQVDSVNVDGKIHEFKYQHFNIECERFPYPDSTFDAVLFCEIIEHLLLSADAPIAEIGRILKPGGYHDYFDSKCGEAC